MIAQEPAKKATKKRQLLSTFAAKQEYKVKTYSGILLGFSRIQLG